MTSFTFTFTFTFSMGLHGQSPSLTSRDRLERAHMSRRSLAVGAHTQSQSHPGTYMRGPTRWSPARPRLVCTFTPPSPHSLPPLRGRLRVLSVPLCAPTSCRVGVFPSLPFTSPRTVSPSSPGVRRRGLCTGGAHVKFAIRIRTCIDLVARPAASASLAPRRVAHDAAHAIISRLIPTGHPSSPHAVSMCHRVCAGAAAVGRQKVISAGARLAPQQGQAHPCCRHHSHE